MEEPKLTETQLQALLRLKRHEQPPPAYFEDLLTSIHRRQREELLRRPAWRLFLDRVRGFVTSMDWNYAAKMAAILMIGVGAIQIALPARKAVVVQDGGNGPGGVVATPVSETVGSGMRPLNVPRKPQGTPAPTRFIIEPMPASYEPTQIRF